LFITNIIGFTILVIPDVIAISNIYYFYDLQKRKMQKMYTVFKKKLILFLVLV